MSEIDHEYTDEIVCPWCGYGFNDSYEISPDDEDMGLIECYDCEKRFYGSRMITIDYSTEKATYGECKHCGDKDVVIESYHGSIGDYEGLCFSCGAKEKSRLLQEHFKDMGN